MFITIQFPISDLRCFSDVDTGKISKPVWPNPVSEQEFIRSFGAVIERNQGGLSGWIGESYVCTANQAIKFKELHHPLYFENKKIKIKHIFRRVYFDGSTTGKFEIGLSITMEEEIGNKYVETNSFSKNILSRIIEYILGFPVWVPENKYPHNEEKHLINIGKSLAIYYLSSTTHNKFPRNEIKDWWVKAGQPILYLECLPEENISIPFYCRSRIENQQFGRLSNYRIKYKGSSYPLWVMEPNSNSSLEESFELKQFLRKVRIFILRAHAEKVSLIYTLNTIDEPIVSLNSNLALLEKYQAYLNKATKRISAIERQSKKIFNTNEASFLTNTNELIDSAFNSQKRKLVKGIRKEIAYKIKHFIELNKNVEIITIVYYSGDELVEKKVEVDQLLDELIQIRTKLKEKAESDRDEEAIELLANAENEVKKGRREAMLDFLAKAGDIVYDIAVDVGASLITKMITQAV